MGRSSKTSEQKAVDAQAKAEKDAAEKAAAAATAREDADAAALEADRKAAEEAAKGNQKPAGAETATLPAPEILEDGKSIKMPEGHTVHYETAVAPVDPNVRVTAAGEVLTSADEQ